MAGSTSRTAAEGADRREEAARAGNGARAAPAPSADGTAGAAAPLEVRADFPILAREQDGRPIAYLDSAATSQKPQTVIDAVSDYYRRSNANIHRGVYGLAQEATDLYEGARERVAAFCRWDPASTIFAKNATEAINLVAGAWGRSQLGPGDEVLITEMEHHSNIVPWQLACAATGATLRWLPVSDAGELALEALDAVLAEGRVRLVGCVHVSNVLGTINPVREICARARAAGALTLVDGSQAVPQMPVEVSAMGCDFYVWTGHKALGPTGIGVLHARRELLEEMPPFLGGGDMISHVGYDASTWNELPWKFEAGTSPIAEGVGLGAAIEYLAELGMERVRAHERELTAYALERLAEVPDLRVLGPLDVDRRGGAVSFALEGIHPHDVAEICDREAVCIRAGHHCAQPLMRRLGVPATARASFHVYNTREDVERLVRGLERARRVFGS
jgi:cysteine desulfurase/selenocysteine lyase